jgi:hypothetical protein
MSKTAQIVACVGAMLFAVCEYEWASEPTAKPFDAITLGPSHKTLFFKETSKFEKKEIP